jgi:hypothetical protein
VTDAACPVGSPLEDAILAWEAAVAAVVQETFRVANGGTDDPTHLAALRVAVEITRQRCEQAAANAARG